MLEVRTLQFVYQYLITPAAVFIIGYTLLRFAGKRAVQEMSSFDLLSIQVMGTAITEPIVTKRLGLASWYSAAVIGTYIIFGHLILNNRFKRILVPRATTLLRGGRVDKGGLRQVHMTIDEFLGKLRVKGYAKASDVELAVMEETGEISVIPKAEFRPLQASDLGITLKRAFIPIPLVIDGQIMDPNLRYLGIKQEDLLNSLHEYDLSQIILATYNENGGIDVDTADAQIKSGPFNYRPGGQDTQQT